MSEVLRRWTIYTLVFCLALPTTGVTQTNSETSPPASTLENTQNKSTSPDDRTRYWVENQGQITEELMKLYHRTVDYMASVENQMGESQFREMLKANQIQSLSEPGVGTAEIKILDGEPFVRIVHEKTEVSFLFVDELKADSPHLRQIEARQHIDAGKSRTDGQKGRDVVFVWLRNEGLARTEESPRPKRFSFRALSDFYYATYKKPTLMNFAFGSLVGAGQAGIAYGLGWAKHMLNPASPLVANEAAWLSFGFGLLLTAYNSTYRNWQNRGARTFLNAKDPHDPVKLNNFFRTLDWKKSLTSKPARSAAVSLLYSYTLLFLMNDSARSISFFDPAGILMHTKMFLMAQLIALPNLLMNNASKIWWQEPAILRSDLRKNTGNLIEFEFLGQTHQLSKVDFEFQMRYFIPFAFKTADLISMGVPIPGFGALPLGRVALLASVALGRHHAVRHAEKEGHPDAAHMRKDFERTWYVRSTRAAQNWFRAKKDSAVGFCSQLFE